MTTLKVALEALTADAALWDDAADAIGNARAAVAGLAIDYHDFSVCGQNAAHAYQAVRAKVEALLASGVTEVRGGADALREVRQEYESADTATREEVGALWEAE